MVRVLHRRPYLIVSLVILVTLLAFYGVIQLRTSFKLEEFLPQDYVSVRVTYEVGAPVDEMVLVEGDDLTTAASFRSIVEFDSELEKNTRFENYIIRVKSYPDCLLALIENYDDLTDVELEAWIQQLLSQPRIVRLTSPLLSENKDAALISIPINSQLPSDELYNLTKALHYYTQSFSENHQSLRMSNTGWLSIESETKEMMDRDNSFLIPAAIIVVILILYLTFRRFSDTGLPFLTLGLGTVWMIGVMGLVDIPFTVILVALVPIILGAGIDYTIHMLNRYYEERGKKLSTEKSIMLSLKTVGAAIFLAAITTMIGFGSFRTSSLSPVQDFGILAAIGVLSIFVLTTTLLPSLLAIRDRRRKRENRLERKRNRKLEKALSKIEPEIRRHMMPILIVVGILTALSIISATRLTTTMSFDTFLPRSAESVATMERIESHFGGQIPAFVLISGNVSTSEGLQLMKNLENSIKSDPQNDQLIIDSSSLAGSISYFYGTIPENNVTLKLILSELKNEYPEMVEIFLIEDNKAVIYFSIQAKTDVEMEKAVGIIRSHVENYSKRVGDELVLMTDGEPAVGGLGAIVSDIRGSLLPSMRNSIIVAILLVGMVSVLVFRSAIIGLLTISPVLLAILWELGVLGVMGWPIDVMNVTVSALAIGIGVDFGIHITHRFREEWEKKGRTPTESISKTIRSVGRAITAAAATTIGAFLVLTLSIIPPIARFGLLAAMIILFALIGALIVLPSALLAYARWKEK